VAVIFFQPVNIAQFGFHWLDQQRFAVDGGNAGKGDRYKQGRDFDVRLALFGQARIAEYTGQEGRGNHCQNHTGAL
jgi:hypothetical protein